MTTRVLRYTRDEGSILATALDHAIVDGLKGEHLSPLVEYKASTRGVGWSEFDDEATMKNVAIARELLARLTKHSWGVATMDEGIVAAKRTRNEAVEMLGFATRYTRRREGKLWHYTSEEGSGAWIGRVPDLLAEGFVFRPDDRYR